MDHIRVAKQETTVWDTTEVFHTCLAWPFIRMYDIKCSLRRLWRSWLESLKDSSRISNYEFCCCLSGVLINVSSGSALIIDKQLKDGVYASVIHGT